MKLVSAAFIVTVHKNDLGPDLVFFPGLEMLNTSKPDHVFLEAAGSYNLIDLDSTSGLRRTSYLRIPAAKRNYVSKSFHMRKACRQWSQHVYQRPLSSSQTAPE
jgi:hypothetical protein